MAYKLKNKISTTRINPETAVPQQIKDQYPWHWNPMDKEHSDHENYIGTLDFDWNALSKWAIDKANQDEIPQKWWWYNDITEEVMHAEDGINHCPIYQQALQHVKQNNFNEHNTQYFKYANETLDEWREPLLKLFPNLKKVGVSLFVQLPGQTIPCHVDTYSSYMRRMGEYPDYTKLKRYMVFVNDWDWGHFFHYGNTVINQWQAGDMWDLRNGVYHGSANAGVNPKITIHWSGEVSEL